MPYQSELLMMFIYSYLLSSLSLHKPTRRSVDDAASQVSQSLSMGLVANIRLAEINTGVTIELL
ncbi:uncharacterized protein BO96DRAFT_417255 [Aspergillus niger CBS 101883]|uniref:uncharacterized protein n=1 Tax=Aspergillus lacticoffeatus (strain CBS 101883) TaxID=1450533 RepID=UPI000D802DD5|nr:uncharacterized protein BO96DRAFT_417255 [Aspergillus niger CBS 101883]PYH50124.1 hypothetical protein BO96DRAFT_417255 [Aspergillus niger CBS 101883]